MQTRKDFLKSLGLGTAALTAVYFGASACSKDSVQPSNTVDFTLDLTATENAPLKSKGGYIIKNDVVVAYTAAGSYVAVTRICSHEGEREVVFQGNQFYCNAHGATFDTSGKGLNSKASGGLKLYQTQLNGTQLRVFV